MSVGSEPTEDASGASGTDGLAAALAGRTTGPVYLPGTADYDTERTGFQRRTPHEPSAIVAATNVPDVLAAVQVAAALGTEIAVQSSGHGLAAPLSGGLLISTRALSQVRVDAANGTARVSAGASWQQVIEATAPHGLAPLSGSAPGVGAVSYTLGGGVGLLARRYGFAAEKVRRFEVVTVDGKLREVTATSEPDLFWALRGGGGNFGVVTGMEIELVPVSTVYGGGLYFDVEQLPDILDAWRRWTLTVPAEMTSAVAMLPFPNLPMIPEALRGKHVAQIQIAYLGSFATGEELVAPLRALGSRLSDTLHELPYTQSSTVFDEPDRPHAYRSENRLLNDLDPQALATITKLAGPSAPVMCVVGLRHLGGALAQPPEVASAVGYRDAAYSLNVLSPVEDGQEDTVRALHREAVAPFAGNAIGRSLNFSYGPLDEEAVQEGFEPQDYRRLTELKARFDPAGLLHCNHPIPALSDHDQPGHD